MQVDEAVDVAERVGRLVEHDLPDGLRPANLAPYLVTVLLPERREVRLHVGPHRQRDDGRDILAFDVERPALGHLARPERGREGIGGPVTAAQSTQVDDVPRTSSGWFGQIG